MSQTRSEFMKQRWEKVRAGELPVPSTVRRAGKYTSQQRYIVDEHRPPKQLRITIKDDVLHIHPYRCSKQIDSVSVSLATLYEWMKRRRQLRKGL